MARPIYLDTCGLKYSTTFMWFASGAARSGTLTQSVCSEMAVLSVSPDPQDRQAAAQAALTIHLLETLPTVKLIRDRKPPLADHTDDDLLLRAQMTRGRILTADGDLQERARNSGVGVIAAQDIYHRFKLFAPHMAVAFPMPGAPVIGSLAKTPRGEVLQVTIIERGKRPDQGVGHMADGRMVVVHGGIAYLGQAIEVRVTNSCLTSSGELLFAVPTAPSNGHTRGDLQALLTSNLAEQHLE